MLVEGESDRVALETLAARMGIGMPAVRVELGYLTSADDREKLRNPQFRDTAAEGLLVAVQRLYLPQHEDPPTGVLRIPAASR